MLLVAAIAALSFVPAGSAHASRPSEETAGSCAPPDVVARYHPDRFSVHVALPTAGCPSGQNGDFSLSMWLQRTDEHTGEGHGRVVSCGPSSSLAAVGGDAAQGDTCELDFEISHPSPEAAYYDLEITYPGINGEESLESHLFCTTGDAGAFCVKAE